MPAEHNAEADGQETTAVSACFVVFVCFYPLGEAAVSSLQFCASFLVLAMAGRLRMYVRWAWLRGTMAGCF